MRMNHAAIIHSVGKYFLMNTAQKTTIIWLHFYRNDYILIHQHIILFDNEFYNYNLLK